MAIPTPTQGIKASLTQTGPDGVEPGIGTSEFWVSAVTEVLAIVDLLWGHHLPAGTEAAIIALVPTVYTIFRSVRKSFG